MRNLLILIVGIVAASSTTDAALKDAITNVAAPFQREIQKHIDTQKQFLGKLLNIDPDSQLSQLFPAIGQLTNLTKLKECYNPSIGDEEFNIFNNTIFDVIKTYYVSLCTYLLTFNFKNFINLSESFSGKFPTH